MRKLIITAAMLLIPPVHAQTMDQVNEVCKLYTIAAAKALEARQQGRFQNFYLQDLNENLLRGNVNRRLRRKILLVSKTAWDSSLPPEDVVRETWNGCIKNELEQ